MKIKYVTLYYSSGYISLNLWLMLPDFYTFWKGLAEGDRCYLELCWKGKKVEEIIKFLEKYHRFPLCRGRIKIMGHDKGLPRKKFSWTRMKKISYVVWTELNTQYPKKNYTPVPIRRVSHFLSLLGIPLEAKIPELKDYITLYILKRDYGGSIRQ